MDDDFSVLKGKLEDVLKIDEEDIEDINELPLVQVKDTKIFSDKEMVEYDSRKAREDTYILIEYSKMILKQKLEKNSIINMSPRELEALTGLISQIHNMDINLLEIHEKFNSKNINKNNPQEIEGQTLDDVIDD